MKKTIKNKVYDTDKALYLGECACEALYRKRTGEFFLHDENGKIIPLTYAEAQAWAEKHIDEDDYFRFFCESKEDGSVAALNIRISAAKMQKLRQAAGKRGVSLVEFVENMIDTL